jgi:hypothetical protein
MSQLHNLLKELQILTPLHSSTTTANNSSTELSDKSHHQIDVHPSSSAMENDHRSLPLSLLESDQNWLTGIGIKPKAILIKPRPSHTRNPTPTMNNGGLSSSPLPTPTDQPGMWTEAWISNFFLSTQGMCHGREDSLCFGLCIIQRSQQA